MSKIWATGLTGTIGKHLPNQVQSLSLDICSDYKKFRTLPVAEADIVIHLAAVVGNENVNISSDYSYAVNVEGTRKLAQLSNERGVRRFIYVSTSHVYAPSQDLLNEDSSLSPLSEYAQQKYQGEMVTNQVFSDSPERACIARVFSVLNWDVKAFTLGGTLKRILKGEENLTIRNVDDIRDFQTPRDYAELLLQLALNREGIGVVNLCTGRGTSVRGAIRKMVNESQFKKIEKRLISGNSKTPKVVGDPDTLLRHIRVKKLIWQPDVWRMDNALD